MKLFSNLKTPTEIATALIADAYFNGEIIESDDVQNYVKQYNINPYVLVFCAINEIEKKTLSNIADIARDYPILNVNWLKTSVDTAKIERDLCILLNIDILGEATLAEGCVIEEFPRPKQNVITQDFDKMRKSKPIGAVTYPESLK